MFPGLLVAACLSTILDTDGDVSGQPDWDFKRGTSLPFPPQAVNVQYHIRFPYVGNTVWSHPATHVQRTNSKAIANTQAKDGSIVRGKHAIVTLPCVIFRIPVRSITRASQLRQRQYTNYITPFVIAKLEPSLGHWNPAAIAYLPHEPTAISLVLLRIPVSICLPTARTVIFAGQLVRSAGRHESEAEY